MHIRQLSCFCEHLTSPTKRISRDRQELLAQIPTGWGSKLVSPGCTLKYGSLWLEIMDLAFSPSDSPFQISLPAYPPKILAPALGVDTQCVFTLFTADCPRSDSFLLWSLKLYPSLWFSQPILVRWTFLVHHLLTYECFQFLSHNSACPTSLEGVVDCYIAGDPLVSAWLLTVLGNQVVLYRVSVLHAYSVYSTLPSVRAES